MEKEDFIRRLVELRMHKGVSARDMSLSIGQSAGYINNIENGVNLPSMTVFFYICEYLEITPKEFFDTDAGDPVRLNDLLSSAKGLSDEQLEHLIAIAKWIK
ncbi:MAG: helix-turn-helix domain-containing protein [Eubacteriales bacterium]